MHNSGRRKDDADLSTWLTSSNTSLASAATTSNTVTQLANDDSAWTRPETAMTHSRFLDLPSELREKIYEHLRPANVTIGDCLLPEVPATAGVCRLVRTEALASYFANSHFVFRVSQDAPHDFGAYPWLHAQQDAMIAPIKTFEFRFFRTDYECTTIAVLSMFAPGMLGSLGTILHFPYLLPGTCTNGSLSGKSSLCRSISMEWWARSKMS